MCLPSQVCKLHEHTALFTAAPPVPKKCAWYRVDSLIRICCINAQIGVWGGTADRENNWAGLGVQEVFEIGQGHWLHFLTVVKKKKKKPATFLSLGSSSPLAPTQTYTCSARRRHPFWPGNPHSLSPISLSQPSPARVPQPAIRSARRE